MITTDTIKNLHDKYTTLGADADACTDRNLHGLMMFALDSDHLDLDGDRLTFAQGSGPLKSVEIERIAGYEDLGSHVAIILPASIVFVGKRTGEVRVFLAE